MVFTSSIGATAHLELSEVLNTSNVAMDASAHDFSVPLTQLGRSAARSLVFIDAGVSQGDWLAAGVAADAEVHVLSSSSAIADITQTLLGRTNLSSVHIVSHGSAGTLSLGGTVLTANTLNQYASMFQSWRSALSDEADLLLYGCDVGQDLGFVSQLAALTGADVAASNDWTGSAGLGGDWDLEVAVGNITSELAFDAWTRSHYVGILPAPVLDNSGSPTLTAINEDVTNSAGTSVSTLLGSSLTDPDNDARAIAVTGVDTANGTWQYSTNGGTTWTGFGPVSNTSATLLGATALYTPAGTVTPQSQGWLSYSAFTAAGPSTLQPFTPNAQGVSIDGPSGGPGVYVGYSNYSATTGALQNSAFPVLDRTAGYTLTFALQTGFEQYATGTSATNPNRAGVSVIALSSDGRGIELGFKNNQIFAQADGITGTGGLFTAAENATFTTTGLTTYTLRVQGDTYQLLAGSQSILTGGLRDYRAFPGVNVAGTTVNPYILPNYVFIGDNTTSASSGFTVGKVAIAADSRVRFVPNANYNGSAGITFRGWDASDGRATGTTGIDVSTNGGNTAFSTAEETATIAINPVNDAPTFTVGANQVVTAGSGAQARGGWATGFVPGPADEATQTIVRYEVVGNTNLGLFAVAPSIANDGTLTYTPGNGAGTATISVRVQDNGGVANGGVDTSAVQTFTVTINPSPTQRTPDPAPTQPSQPAQPAQPIVPSTPLDIPQPNSRKARRAKKRAKLSKIRRPFI